MIPNAVSAVSPVRDGGRSRVLPPTKQSELYTDMVRNNDFAPLLKSDKSWTRYVQDANRQPICSTNLIVLVVLLRGRDAEAAPFCHAARLGTCNPHRYVSRTHHPRPSLARTLFPLVLSPLLAVSLWCLQALSSIRPDTFAQHRAHLNRNYRCAPYKEQQHFRTPSESIGNNYSPAAANLKVHTMDSV